MKALMEAWHYPLLLCLLPGAYWIFAWVSRHPDQLCFEIGVALAFIGGTLLSYQSTQICRHLCLSCAYALHCFYTLLHPAIYQIDFIPGWWLSLFALLDLLVAGVLFVFALYKDPVEQ